MKETTQTIWKNSEKAVKVYVNVCPQGLATPMLRCPSQRLLDRIVRRYFEVADVGSVQMKHFTTKDKLRLLYTLAVNQQPLILQV